MPLTASARSSCAGESTLTGLTAPRATEICAARSVSLAGRNGCPAVAGGRGPSTSVSSRSCTSARQGRPAAVISAATRPPADSAAVSSPNLAGSASLRILACCSACTATRAAISARGSCRAASSASNGSWAADQHRRLAGISRLSRGRGQEPSRAVPRRQQGRREVGVVTPRDPDARPEQVRIQHLGRPPDPPNRVGGPFVSSDRGSQIRDGLRLRRDRVVVGQPAQQSATTTTRHDCYPHIQIVLHAADRIAALAAETCWHPATWLAAPCRAGGQRCISRGAASYT